MSNWIDYDLDVLANSPAEINQITGRLGKPSDELKNWLAKQFGQPLSEVTENLKELLEFKVITNLGYVHDSVNKARRFGISFKDRCTGIVRSHLREVSQTFPKAIFLLTYCDMQSSYSGKEVIRDGEVIQSIHNGNQKAQAVDWALLDIFAPFRSEYESGLKFGSLWEKWLDDLIAGTQRLRDRYGGDDESRSQS